MMLVYVSQCTVMLIWRSLDAKTAWRLSLVTYALSLVAIIHIQSTLQFYVSSVINGISMAFFFVFYNIAHFAKTDQPRTGTSSALMFNVGPVLSLVAPLFAGFLGQQSMMYVWIVSGILLVLTYVQIGVQENFDVHYGIRQALREIRATRVCIFLEGIWEALVLGIIPIYTVYFIKTPLSYGVYVAYLSLVGIVANFLLGHITDKLQKRIVFLYPLTIVLGATTLLFPLATHNLTMWFIVTGCIQFFLPLFWNVSTAMVIDTHKNLLIAIPGREITLATGRILGLLLAAASFALEREPRIIFFVLGGVMLLYPYVLYWNSRVKKTYKYL